MDAALVAGASRCPARALQAAARPARRPLGVRTGTAVVSRAASARAASAAVTEPGHGTAAPTRRAQAAAGCAAAVAS